MLPFKTPNVLFSEKSLGVAEADLGAAPESLSQTKLSGAAGRAGASSNSRFTPGAGSHLGQEQSPFQGLFFTGLRLPSSQLKNNSFPMHPIRTHRQPHKSGDPGGAVSSGCGFHVTFLAVESP